MTRCTRCGRTLKHASPTGMGPRCELTTLGPRPKRQAAPAARPARVLKDDATPDLFDVWPMVVAA